MKTKTKKNVFPQKKEERSLDADSESVMADDSPPPEQAKSVTTGEAQRIVDLNLKPVELTWFDIRIFGPDLITHAWSEKAIKEMLRGQQMNKEEKRLAKDKREPKNPEEEFQGARYYFDGKDWFPVNAIKKAMVDAGFARGIQRTIVQRSVLILGPVKRDYAEIKYRKIVRREDPVRVGPRRDADLRYRPEYQDWSMDLRMRIRNDIFTIEKAIMLLSEAGFSIGIGEWRTQKNGQHGSFEVEHNPAKPAKRGAHAA